jgi:signal-transduction protein with cAMP-binding, CBS, and nucleotidyltransferase domain
MISDLNTNSRDLMKQMMKSEEKFRINTQFINQLKVNAKNFEIKRGFHSLKRDDILVKNLKNFIENSKTFERNKRLIRDMTCNEIFFQLISGLLMEIRVENK